jgi:putative endonuclease
MKLPAIYLLASKKNGTLYLGVTSNLIARTWQHREHLAQGFTKQYDVTVLVWYELCDSMDAAIQREKQVKKWNRQWKINMIERGNPGWRDLWPEINGAAAPMDPRLRGDDEPKLDSRLRGNDEHTA